MCEHPAWQGTILCQSVTVAGHSEENFGEKTCERKGKNPDATSSLTAAAAVQTVQSVGLAEKPEESSRKQAPFCVYQSSLFSTELIQLTARKMNLSAPH